MKIINLNKIIEFFFLFKRAKSKASLNSGPLSQISERLNSVKMTLLLTMPVRSFIVGALKHTKGCRAAALPVKLRTTLLIGIWQGPGDHSLVS